MASKTLHDPSTANLLVSSHANLSIIHCSMNLFQVLKLRRKKEKKDPHFLKTLHTLFLPSGTSQGLLYSTSNILLSVSNARTFSFK